MTDLSMKALTHEREQLKDRLLRQLDSTAHLAATIRKDVEKGEIYWWADHSQGLVHRATEAERLLNRVLAYDLAIRTVTETEQYERETAADTTSGPS